MKKLTSSQKEDIIYKATLIIIATSLFTLGGIFKMNSKEFFIWGAVDVFCLLTISKISSYLWNRSSICKNKTISYDVLAPYFQENLGINKDADLLIKQELELLVSKMFGENPDFISEKDHAEFLEEKEEIISRMNKWISEGVNKQIRVDKKIVELQTGLKYEGEFFLTKNDIVKLLVKFKSKDEESTYTFRKALSDQIKQIYINNAGQINFSVLNKEVVSFMNYNSERYGSLYSRENESSITLSEKISLDFENIIDEVYEEEKKHDNLLRKNTIGLKIVK